MTAFAALRRRIGDGLWLEGEGRCLNHRQLDLQLRLPEALRWLEPRLRARLAGAFARGRVEIALRLGREAEGEPPLSLDRGLVRRLAALVAELREAIPGLAPGSAGELVAWPGLVREAEPDRERLGAEAEALLAELLAALKAERAREGSELGRAIRERLEQLAAGVAREQARLPQLAAAARERLAARLAELGVTVDEARLAQELALLLARGDVAEELERLAVHGAEALRLLDREGEPVGRRLDFLLQELGREAGTLAAKAPDLGLSRFALEARVLIEQMREQAQNLE